MFRDDLAGYPKLIGVHDAVVITPAYSPGTRGLEAASLTSLTHWGDTGDAPAGIGPVADQHVDVAVTQCEV